MPTYPQKLMYARYVAVFCALVTTACVVAFAAKSLKDVAANRKELRALDKTGVLDVSDMTAVTSAVVATSAFGVVVSLISEFFLGIERRRGLSAGKRIFNEVLLALASLALLACCIAGTIVSKGSGKITSKVFPQETIDAILQAKHKSLKYRDQWAWKAIIVGWAAFGFLLITLGLVLATGAYYRKHGSSARAPEHLHARDDEFHSNSSEKGENEFRA